MAVNYAPPKPKIYYPDSDGAPMAESDFQRQSLTYAVEALGIFFAGRPDVYVSGNMFLYYEKGNPQAVVAPDVFVVLGIPKAKRRSYLLWKEGKAPDFVLEITSESTPAGDQGPKRGLYALLGVREYFLFDPTSDYLEPPLQGLRLEGNSYEPLPGQLLPDGGLSLHSETLGLELRLDAKSNDLRFFDPASGQILLSHAEATARAERAEAEVERLRVELARLRGES